MRQRVEVVVAVHTTSRPVGRAVASVLDGNGADSMVTVVCHDVGAEAIAALIDPAHRPLVRLLEHRDGVRSAAGPFNAGMRAARSEFVSIMGSDDTLEPGAVASWLATADRSGADTVVTRLVRGAGRAPVHTPPTRPFRSGHLDPVRDRLSYRSAPLGLVSVARREQLGLELAEGLAVGEDVPYVTRLWCETTVAYDRRGPAYRIGEDAGERVTLSTRPVRDELAFVGAVLDAEWFDAYPSPVRAAVVLKLARIHLFGVVANRADPQLWTAQERAALADVAGALESAAPGYAAPLSLADRALLDAVREPATAPAELTRLAQARRRHGTPRTLVPRDLRRVLHREAPPRFMLASALTR